MERSQRNLSPGESEGSSEGSSKGSSEGSIRLRMEREGMLIPEVRFAEEIERFEAAVPRPDRSAGSAAAEAVPLPPRLPRLPTGRRAASQAAGGRSCGVLFVGDSDIRLWSRDGQLESDFAGLPGCPGGPSGPGGYRGGGVLNRGFGGARTWEVLLYFPRIVLPHRPRVIVYCCGDNDIARLKEQGVSSAVTGFRVFLDLVAAHLPAVRRIFYLAIHPSPADKPLWGFIERANSQIRAICQASGVAEFVDYLHLLQDERNRPRGSLFMPDRLHFTPQFYRQLGAFLRPRIEAAME